MKRIHMGQSHFSPYKTLVRMGVKKEQCITMQFTLSILTFFAHKNVGNSLVFLSAHSEVQSVARIEI